MQVEAPITPGCREEKSSLDDDTKIHLEAMEARLSRSQEAMEARLMNRFNSLLEHVLDRFRYIEISLTSVNQMMESTGTLMRMLIDTSLDHGRRISGLENKT